jgi:hypothetical protein
MQSSRRKVNKLTYQTLALTHPGGRGNNNNCLNYLSDKQLYLINGEYDLRDYSVQSKYMTHTAIPCRRGIGKTGQRLLNPASPRVHFT